MFLNNEQNFDPYFNHFIVLKNDQKRFKKRSPREEIEENEKRRCGKTATRSQKHRPLAHSRKRSVKPRYDNARGESLTFPPCEVEVAWLLLLLEVFVTVCWVMVA